MKVTHVRAPAKAEKVGTTIEKVLGDTDPTERTRRDAIKGQPAKDAAQSGVPIKKPGDRR